jgi:squalene monooxygenase
VNLIEATVTDLIEDNSSARRVIGVRALLKGEEGKQSFLAGLVIVADGCYSNFRTSVLGSAAVKPTTKSHFVGTILKDVVLPMPNCGTVALIKGSGPVLMYQISEHDTRILIDVKQPIPSDLKVNFIYFFSSSFFSYTKGPHPCQHCPTTPGLRPARSKNGVKQ